MLAGVAGAVLTLAACSGEIAQSGAGSQLLSGGGAAATGSITTEAAGSTQDGKQAPFDPFNRQSDTASPLREVIKNPTVAEVMQAGPLQEMALGRADAPVTIIKYMSLTCPFCRQFQQKTFPELKREYIDKGKVRLILREFPIGFQSGTATIALRCASTDKYFELYGRFLNQQARWVSQDVRKDPIYEIAKEVGVSRPAFDACMENRALIEGLKWVKDRGRTLGIIGTPNFFVDGKLVKSVLTMAEIRAMIDPLIASRVAGGASGTTPTVQ